MTRHILVGIMLSLSWLAGCASDEPAEQSVSPDEKVSFELFTNADPYGLPASRAGADETGVVKTPWVLVFSGSNANATFVEAVQAEVINSKSYVSLSVQTGACQLFVLANPEANFYVGNTAYTFSAANFDTVLKSPVRTLAYASENIMSTPLSNPQTSVPFVGSKLPMSALVSMPKIDASVSIPQINLQRTVGKVIVDNTASGFTLKGITAVVNTPKHTRLYNHNNSLTYNTVAANLVEYHANATYSADIAPAVSNSTATNPIYLYESECAASSNNTCLIIRANYDGEDFFYKMAFVDNAAAQLDIRRNFEYTFTITAVNARGFSTMADAKASKPLNTDLDYVITTRDDSGYEIMSNNDYYMAVTNSWFELLATGGSTAYTAFTLATDCSTAFPDKRKITSLTSGLTIVSPAGGTIPLNTTTDVTISVTPAFTQGQIEIHLGNLKKIITVRRKNPVAAGTTISEFYQRPAGVTYLSASVVDYPMDVDGNPQANYWLQLSPGGSGQVRNDPHKITVDNGLIDLKVGTNPGATGYVYVSTRGGDAERIKVCVTQN